MTTTTMTNRKLEIQGMTGDVCVKKVTAALKAVPDVYTQSVAVGSAAIRADETGCGSACKAVSAAGYEAHEADSAEDSVAPESKGFGQPGEKAQGAPTGRTGANGNRDGNPMPGQPGDSTQNIAYKQTH
ncbi:MAG TPA: hypothetical protein VHN77_02500 [Phycisphaerales bacterium]|nr:hypothetical protein [Phycisphaerales bacterium]